MHQHFLSVKNGIVPGKQTKIKQDIRKGVVPSKTSNNQVKSFLRSFIVKDPHDVSQNKQSPEKQHQENIYQMNHCIKKTTLKSGNIQKRHSISEKNYYDTNNYSLSFSNSKLKESISTKNKESNLNRIRVKKRNQNGNQDERRTKSQAGTRKIIDNFSNYQITKYKTQSQKQIKQRNQPNVVQKTIDNQLNLSPKHRKVHLFVEGIKNQSKKSNNLYELITLNENLRSFFADKIKIQKKQQKNLSESNILTEPELKAYKNIKNHKRREYFYKYQDFIREDKLNKSTSLSKNQKNPLDSKAEQDFGDGQFYLRQVSPW